MPAFPTDLTLFPGGAEHEWSAAELFVADLLARNFNHTEAAKRCAERGFVGMGVRTIENRLCEHDFLALVAKRTRELIQDAVREESEDADILRTYAAQSLSVHVRRARRVAEEQVKAGVRPEDAEVPLFSKPVEAVDAMVVARRMKNEALGIGRGTGVQVNLQNNTQVNVIQAGDAGLRVRDVDAFLHEDLGLARGVVYRRVCWELRQADRSEVRRVLACEGMGSGKSWLGSLMLARVLQRLFAATRDDLARVYHAEGPRPRLGVINLSASGAVQAQLVMFSDLRRWLAGQWFARLPMPTRDVADLVEWELADRVVIAYCGSSSSKAVQGVHWVAAAADEVCRLPEKSTANVESADALVGPVEATMISRCGDAYKLCVSSYPEGRRDYLNTQVALVRDAGQREGTRAGVVEELGGALLAEPISWGHADAAREAALRAEPFVGYPTDSYLTRDGTLVCLGPVWAFKPDVSLDALRQSEARDPSGFAAMFGAQPRALSVNPYYKDPECVARGANAARENPLGPDGRLRADWKADGAALYYGHLDAALGKKGGDAAGLAVAHWKDGRVVVDALREARAQEGQELKLDDLVEWFLDFQRCGATFAKVTRDGWEGAGIGQRFESRGVPTELFSVDRDRRAYDTFRDMLFAGLVDYPPYEPLFQNARDLVVVGPRKVDHRAGGAKDVHDAVSAAVYHVVCEMGEFAGVKPAAIDPEPPKDEEKRT